MIYHHWMNTAQPLQSSRASMTPMRNSTIGTSTSSIFPLDVRNCRRPLIQPQSGIQREFAEVFRQMGRFQDVEIHSARDADTAEPDQTGPTTGKWASANTLMSHPGCLRAWHAFKESPKQTHHTPMWRECAYGGRETALTVREEDSHSPGKDAAALNLTIQFNVLTVMPQLVSQELFEERRLELLPKQK